MLKDKEDLLRFIQSVSSCHLGDIWERFSNRGKDFSKNLTSYLIELKDEQLINFPGSRPDGYCWIKITNAGKERLEQIDRQIERETFNRDHLLKRVIAAERSAAAIEADSKESRRIADAAESHAKAAENKSNESDKKASNANRIAFAALIVAVINLLLDHWDKISNLKNLLITFIKALT